MVITDYTGNPQLFAVQSSRWAAIGARVVVEDANGTHHAFRLSGGEIVAQTLVIPSPAKQASNATEAARIDALATRRTNMLNEVRQYVSAVKAKQANQRTPEEKVIRALAWLLSNELDP